MNYKNITREDLQYFQKVLSESRVLHHRKNLEENSHDRTEDLTFLPQAVLLPESTAEVAQILKYCNQHHICITPRGAGTGLSGGSIPVAGGVSLDFRKMDKILAIDEDNFQVTTQPGVVTEALQKAVEAKGLFYPVDPASKGSCFIGGNVAENSGGPRAVKYGTVKDYVLNLEIVLPDGTIMHTGANTLKNATGYNLTHLIVGSEGTLAVITQITLKLLPLPTKQLLMLAPFTSAYAACKGVTAILKAGITPSALEFMEKEALLFAQRYLKESPVKIPEHVKAHLLIELDGFSEDDLYPQAEAVNEVLSTLTQEDILLAVSKREQESLWKMRRVVGAAVKGSSIYKEEDTVVPRAHIPELLQWVKAVGEKYDFQSVCYGHTGDGNLHVNILKGAMSDKKWNEEILKAIEEIFQFVIQKGGTLSGEHGIGYVQKRYMPIAFSQEAIALMKAIKQVFDPNAILNPEKLFPKQNQIS